METPALFKLSIPRLKDLSRRWVSLLASPTPVASLSSAARVFGHDQIFVKREDLTATGYGGNKVRNLEFLLGDALSRGATRVVTAAPLGSNFTAALAAQARKINLPVDIFHFVPQQSEQITRHANFTRNQGANMTIYSGPAYLNAARAFLKFQAQRFDKSYLIAPGGSSSVGVLGHISAALELAEQVQRKEIPEPDFIFVGVGTCGTMAGLVSGLKLAGLRTRVIGVRCVDRIVCNRLHIRNLANAALKDLDVPLRLRLSDIDLRDNDFPLSYGEPMSAAVELSHRLQDSSQLTLDTTYTSKVAYFMKNALQRESLQSKNLLYWHTFSPAAMRSISLAA